MCVCVCVLDLSGGTQHGGCIYILATACSASQWLCKYSDSELNCMNVPQCGSAYSDSVLVCPSPQYHLGCCLELLAETGNRWLYVLNKKNKTFSYSIAS